MKLLIKKTCIQKLCRIDLLNKIIMNKYRSCKKKVLCINSFINGSTGTIMADIADYAARNGFDVYMACPRSRSNRTKRKKFLYIGNPICRNIHIRLSQITGLNGIFSIVDTLIFLTRVRMINPEIIHLHNLHNCYINLPLLFRFIKKSKIKVIWTLHDCWAFTGQCPYFTMIGCDKWKYGCGGCPQLQVYPSAMADQTRTMWNLKKKWFTGVDDLTIITPSHWLANLVRKSFLKCYPVKVINNGIDLEVFKPRASDFREHYDIAEGERILLGVASEWNIRKGLDVFIKLAKELDGAYVVTLVGVTNEIKKTLPKKIIAIKRTQNIEELTKIYSAADIFVNPTREDNFPTVNIEALACGIPVVTTLNSGGSAEIIDRNCGISVSCEDRKALKEAIIQTCKSGAFTKKKCLNRAKQFSRQRMCKEYLEVYGL